MAKSEPPGSPLLDKKYTIMILQWLIVIASSYLVLFNQGSVSEDRPAYGLVVILLISILVLYRLPTNIFNHRFFDTTLLLVDTVLISAAIYMKRDAPWDLLLVYFFILFLAAIGADMLKIVLGSVIISLIHVALLLQPKESFDQIRTDVFIRIPFLFGVCILYGYLSENARREKRRAEMAEEREHLKTDLVSALAHDIKNPLGIIMGYTESIMQRFAGRSEEKFALEALERILYNGQRIVNLLTGFLDASKAEAEKLPIIKQPVSLNSLIKKVLQQQEWEIQKKGLGLELKLDEKLPKVPGDEGQFDRVFRNLIGNAIKFTPTGGSIMVSSRREYNHVCVSVKDTGIGIPQDEIPLLFSQFRRLKGSAKIEGTGLGLFIVKTIIEAYKGTVHAESSGQGAIFTVRIPIR